MCLKNFPNSQKYKVIKVPKSPGIQSHHRLSAEETSTKLYEAYLDYFKGRFSEIFSKSANWREIIQMPNYLRRELDPQPVSIVLEKIRIFEVKGLEIDLSALPAGSTQTEWTTVIDYIRPADFESNFSKHSGKILANLKPRDGKLLM